MANKLLKELKDIHLGEDIWIVDGGSSMNNVAPSFFENKITMGVNQTHEKYICDYIAGKNLNIKPRDIAYFDGKAIKSTLQKEFWTLNPLI